jgi:XTP/dITP diphosphohydrolase
LLLLATTNADKVREVRALLPGRDLRTLADFPPVPEPTEAGATFEENARTKATDYARALARWLPADALVVAEDSGLVVDALDGAPGVQSARFLGAAASYPERCDEIARRLAARPTAPRSARFVCAMAVVDRTGVLKFEATGTVEGLVLEARSGTGGFGYDPIFFYPPYGKTLSDMSQAEKGAASHRGHAFRALAAWLSSAERGHNDTVPS